VRWNVARHFPLSRRVKGKGWQVDLAGELVRQARRQGVPASHIQLTDACTRHGRHFYSYRRERTAARQISVIMLQARNQHGFS
jgi:copper oxidase (laccase) domain-containing protein